MCTASSPVAASPRTATSGSPAGRDSSCRWRVLSRLFRRRFLEELDRAHRAGQLQLLRRARAAGRCQGLRSVARATAPVRVGGLRQTPVCRAPERAGIPVAIHPPGGDLQPALARARRARGHLPLERLPCQGPHALQNHDAQRQRVHAPLPTARAARGLPSHPALRSARQRLPQANLARARALLHAPAPEPPSTKGSDPKARTTPPTFVCAHCGCAMLIVQTFTPERTIRAPPQHPPTP